MDDIFQRLIRDYGLTILDDAERCRGVLLDLAAGDFRKEVHVFYHALIHNIPSEIRRCSTSVVAVQLPAIANRFHDVTGFDKDLSLWAVNTIAGLLGVISRPITMKAISSSKAIVPNAKNLRNCPFCAELIQKEAKKCRFCGEFLD